MSIHVCVTQEDIDKGIKEDVNNCAVALAVKRLFPEDRNVYVENPGIDINGEFYLVPKHIEEFINNFDNGLPVEPVEFDMCEKDYEEDYEEEYEEEFYSDCGIIDYL